MHLLHLRHFKKLFCPTLIGKSHTYIQVAELDETKEEVAETMDKRKEEMAETVEETVLINEDI